MMRDELRRRQALLHAMGITTWYPRALLPGAPPPLEWSEGEDALLEAQPGSPEVASEVPSAVPREESPRPPPAPREGRAAAGLGSSAPPRVDAAAVAVPPSPARPTPAQPARVAERSEARAPLAGPGTAAPPRFSLVFLNAGAGLGLVALLPQTAEAWLGPVRRGLLTELLEARTGLRLAPELSEQPFRWPLPGLEDSAEAARAALGGFLDSQAEEAGCRVLLVLGEQLTPLLPLDVQVQRGIPYSLSEQAWRLLLTRSLDEALAVPALKRELWRDLAPLAGALR